MPDAADKLIIALGLGSSGQDYSSVHPSRSQPASNGDILYDSPISNFYYPQGSGSGSGHYYYEFPSHFDEEEDFQPCPSNWHDQRICRHLGEAG